MILTKDINIKVSFKKSYLYLKKITNTEGFFLVLWLLGPFIYLIERSPADIWLTLMVIVFLLRSYFQNDWHWTKIKWFRFAFVFWIISLFSALLGPMPIFSTGEGFVWIRFPLYAVAVQYWLGSNRDIRVIMLYFIIIGMMLMSTILFLETIIEPK